MSDAPHRPNQQPGDALLAAGVEPVHPGEFFARRLPGLKMTGEQAATAIGIEPRTMSEFLEGRGHVDRTLADGLSRLTGTTSQFWQNMQAAHDNVARKRGTLSPSP